MATSQNVGLKRKYRFSEEDATYSSSSPSSHSEWDSDEDIARNYTMTFVSDFVPPSSPISNSSILKRKNESQSKGRVRFGIVTVFLFQRCQGFSSVPSHGGCTLGMASRHSVCQKFTLTEHAVEQRRLRMERLRERQREEKLEALRQRLIISGTLTLEEAASLTANDVSDDDVEESNPKLVDGSLRPYSSKRRRLLLRAAGVLRIDREEKKQLQELRQWREDCGCHCRGFCEPETCACSLAGIKCQMDRSNFPCGCSKEGCGNTSGRIEFNSSHVRSHYIHTHMKLVLESRLQKTSHKRPAVSEQNLPKTNRNIVTLFPLSPSPDLCRMEDSCWGSDMTDTCCSSPQSLGSEAEENSSRQATCDVNNSGLAQILSFSDSDRDECPFIRDHISMQQSVNQDLCRKSTKTSTQSECSPLKSQLEYLDENANQATLDFANEIFDIPNTPSLSPECSMNCYMDLSLSSDSDLIFFDSFFEFGPSLSQSHFKVCDHLEHVSHLSFPRCPSPALAEDSGVSLLESLVEIS